MDTSLHTLNNLFAQLGLPASDEAIEQFIQSHQHLPGYVTLADAPFWTPAQAAFFREEILKDADWAEIIDQLNARLHAK